VILTDPGNADDGHLTDNAGNASFDRLGQVILVFMPENF
jgi:hypothetical protein